MIAMIGRGDGKEESGALGALGKVLVRLVDERLLKIR
jgi:hypothetical protein